MVVESRVRFSYREYQHLPDDKRCEVIDGDLLMSPAPTPYHQKVLSRLYEAMAAFVRERKLGDVYFAPCDVVLSDYDIVQPDIIFIGAARLGIIGPKFIAGAPDLVMELFTEPSAYRDLVVKKTLYARAGIPEYWLVDLQARRIEVLSLGKSAYETAGVAEGDVPASSRLLGGFTVAPSSIF
jgi:Uma2 family endonuclease